MVVLQHGLKLSAGCINLGVAGQGQLMPVFCLGLPGMSYKMFVQWLLLVLGLEMTK